LKKEYLRSDKTITRWTIRWFGNYWISENVEEVYMERKWAPKEWNIKSERVANLEVKIVWAPNKDNTMSAIYDDITKGIIK